MVESEGGGGEAWVGEEGAEEEGEVKAYVVEKLGERSQREKGWESVSDGGGVRRDGREK